MGARAGKNQFAEENCAAMASGAAVASGVHHPGAAGSCGPSPALRCRAWISVWATATSGRQGVLSCTDTLSRHPVTATRGDNHVPCRWRVHKSLVSLYQGELSSQENFSPLKTPPEASHVTPGASNSWGSPNYRRLPGSPGAAGALYLSLCHSWRAAAAHPPRAGLSVPGGCCSLMPSVRPSVRLSARVRGPWPEGSPRAAVSSPASPARGLTSLPSAAAPA